jgi:energy-coupling factor transporter ATP-binding protein EcfA2
MFIPPDHPADYRSTETAEITTAIRAGECVSLVGLSGAGKSNLLAHLVSQASRDPPVLLADGNRLPEFSAPAVIRLLCETVAAEPVPGNAAGLADLEQALRRRLEPAGARLCLALDLSMPFSRAPGLAADPLLNGNLRSLRDAWKYRLTYIVATRHDLPPHTELSELCFARTVRLGPLAEADARWTVSSYAQRRGIAFDGPTVDALIAVTGGYPAFLRAACEACAAGAAPDPASLAAHPAVKKRVEEFRADRPTDEEIRQSGLAGLPLLAAAGSAAIDTDQLTAKELLLLEFLRGHAGEICAKDDLIRAVWPEDRVFERGVRDDSLAQLVRRLREKVETDPSDPAKIRTVTGRGYRFVE